MFSVKHTLLALYKLKKLCNILTRTHQEIRIHPIFPTGFSILHCQLQSILYTTC